MKNYQIILKNILSPLSDSEKSFLIETINEEVKRLWKNDNLIEGEKQPRKLLYTNRDFYDVTTPKLSALDIIKDPFGLESPLQALNYLINNIIPLDEEKVLALRFLSKSFKSETGEGDLIVKKIDNIIFKKSDYTSYKAEIISELIAINYGQTTRGIKYFEKLDKFVLELRRIYRRYNFRYPIEDVIKINKMLLSIINLEIRRNSTKQNQENKALLEELKIEIENN